MTSSLHFLLPGSFAHLGAGRQRPSPRREGAIVFTIPASPGPKLLPPAPSLERRPDAALEPEAVDRRRRVDGADAGEADAGPLEAALLQHTARGGVGDAGAGRQRIVRK